MTTPARINENQKEGSAPDNILKRPQFGNRHLTDTNNVFQHNAWDNVTWDSEQEAIARKKVSDNSSEFLSDSMKDQYEVLASNYWDQFYGIHQNKFFKDRHWLFTEFPELAPNLESKPKTSSDKLLSKEENVLSNTEEEMQQLKISHNESCCNFPGSEAKHRILEIGCGVGNTVFPILETNNKKDTFVYGCDFSSVAIDVLKDNTLYNPSRCHAFVCDVTTDDWNVPFPPESLDIAILIFVLSAINPNKMENVLNHIYKYLKPGGLVLLRDYGRYDMAQLRFKKGRCISENFYVRGDGTCVYFFTQEEITKLFTKVGFTEEYNLIDRRLQVNRGKLLKMYRVWIQGKYKKPFVTENL